MKTMTTRIAAALGGLLLAGGTQAQEDNKLYLFNWTQYMDPAIIDIPLPKWLRHPLSKFIA